MTIDELIGRVEQATDSSRELDREVALAGGWECRVVNPHEKVPDGDAWRFGDMSWTIEDYEHPPAYTSSIDAIVGLIEAKLPGWLWEISSPIGNSSRAVLANPKINEPSGSNGDGSTPALALCAAFLKALRALQQKEMR